MFRSMKTIFHSNTMHRLENKRQYVFDSDEEKQELIQDILSGMYYKEIEVKYDVNEKSIRNLCMRENINVTKLRKKSKEYRTEKAIAMFREGKTLSECSASCRISIHTIKANATKEDYECRIKNREIGRGRKIDAFEEEDKIIRNRHSLKGWKPPLLNDETRKITDFGKLKALNNAGWCVENIADEFGVTIEEVNRCLEVLSSR